jgi:hypothetical protein
MVQCRCRPPSAHRRSDRGRPSKPGSLDQASRHHGRDDASLRCSPADCDEPRTTRRDHALGQFCDAHRYYRPVQHDRAPALPADRASHPAARTSGYCSKRCRNRLSARRTYTPRPRSPRRRLLVCEGCGVTYLAVWGRFCSPACTNRAWNQRRREAYLEGKKRNRRAAKARGAEWVQTTMTRAAMAQGGPQPSGTRLPATCRLRSITSSALSAQSRLRLTRIPACRNSGGHEAESRS